MTNGGPVHTVSGIDVYFLLETCFQYLFNLRNLQRVHSKAFYNNCRNSCMPFG